ncbi:MAG: hypothetical protein AB7G28_26470 [Pirellulales bacterium]
MKTKAIVGLLLLVVIVPGCRMKFRNPNEDSLLRPVSEEIESSEAPAVKPAEETVADAVPKCVSLEQASLERGDSPKHPLLGRCADWTTDKVRIYAVEFDGPNGLEVRAIGRMPQIERFLSEHRWHVYGEISDVSEYINEITVDGTIEMLPAVDEE